MIKLVWIIAILTANGPVFRAIPETTTFKDIAACEKFGEEMSKRVEDWARGALNADWDVEIKSAYQYEKPGQPV